MIKEITEKERVCLVYMQRMKKKEGIYRYQSMIKKKENNDNNDDDKYRIDVDFCGC